MQCEIGAKCNKGHHTVIRNGSQGLLDYVIRVGWVINVVQFAVVVRNWSQIFSVVGRKRTECWWKVCLGLESLIIDITQNGAKMNLLRTQTYFHPYFFSLPAFAGVRL